MPGLRPDRASTIVGGLAILIGLFRELVIPVMTPIEAGLRMGVMWDLYLRSTKRDRREQSVQGCMEKFHIDQQRAGRVAEHGDGAGRDDLGADDGPDQGGFAAPGGAEQPGDRAASDGHRDIREGGALPTHDVQVCHLDGGLAVRR